MGRNLVRDLGSLHLLANSTIMSTLTVRCRWEDQTARERTVQPPSYAEVKKFKAANTSPMADSQVKHKELLLFFSSSFSGFEPDAFG